MIIHKKVLFERVRLNIALSLIFTMQLRTTLLAVDNMVWRANTGVTQDGGGHGDTLACITFTTISTTAE